MYCAAMHTQVCHYLPVRSTGGVEALRVNDFGSVLSERYTK